MSALSKLVGELLGEQQPSPLSAAEVRSLTDAFRAAFLAHQGPEAAARFAMPADFVAYLRANGGARIDGRVIILSAEEMLSSTVHWMGVFASTSPEPMDEDEEPADGPWIKVAFFGDKHWLFLCCDRAHPEHGHVAEGYDLVPWMDVKGLDLDLASVLDPWGATADADRRSTLAGMLRLLKEQR